MVIVADSGATKTDWACFDRHSDWRSDFSSQGYNPNYISQSEIVADIRKAIPKSLPIESVIEMHFYGAGVTPMQYDFMKRTMKMVFTSLEKIEIAMDTLASCRALLGTDPGFSAILGTGANSCLYDGRNEGLNVDSCGFILGDEGSGAYLGKRMITDFIRKRMPIHVYKIVGQELGFTGEELLDIIYTKAFPNRFCAQYARFIYDNLEFDPYFKNLVTDSFRKFFETIVIHYPDYTQYKFNSVGSVGFYFRELLKPIVKEFGMEVGIIAKSPLEGLVAYHKQNL